MLRQLFINIPEILALALVTILLVSCGDDGSVMQPPVTRNSSPVADAGTDQTLALPDTVTLDGSGSSDNDGDALIFSWGLITIPPASSAVLSDSTAEMPTFIADVTGEYMAQLVVSDGEFDSAPDTVAIHVGPTPGIAPFSRTIGAGLQFAGSARLDVSDHGGITVRITSSNPATALIAPDAGTPGSSFADVFVPNDSARVNYTVQGVAGTTGIVTVTASAPGFTDGAATITVVQPGVTLSGLDNRQSVGIQDVFTVLLGIPNSTGSGLNGLQAASAANAAPLAVAIASDDPGVGQFSASGDTSATATIDFTAGMFQSNVAFVPLSPGMATVMASSPGFLSTDSASVDVSVDGPGITLFSRTIGAGLQFSGRADLAISDHGGITLRLESSDSTVALVAPDASTAGSRFIDVFVPDGSTAADYTVQGVAGATGTVTITASAPAFAGGAGTIDVVQPGLAIGALGNSQSVGMNRSFSVRIGIPDGMGGLSGLQGVSAANVPPLALKITSSNGAVGHVAAAGDTSGTIMIELAAGEFQPSVTFVPKSPGSTTVSASIPGFLSTTAASVDITVDPPNLSPFSRTIGAGLQFSGNAGLDVADHGGVTVRIASSDAATALIAPDGNTPGSGFIDVFVPNGSAVASYTVQGVFGASGSVLVTASAPGFSDGNGTIDVVQPGVAISGLATTRPVGSNDVFSVFIGIPNAAGTGLNGFQAASAANIPPLVLTVTSNNGTVGQVSAFGNTGATITFDMTAGMFQPSVTFEPLAVGATTVSASIPGFLSTTAATVDINVEP